jgi:hypothetical protein
MSETTLRPRPAPVKRKNLPFDAPRRGLLWRKGLFGGFQRKISA